MPLYTPAVRSRWNVAYNHHKAGGDHHPPQRPGSRKARYIQPEGIIAVLAMRNPDEYEAASHADTDNYYPDSTVKVGNPESRQPL